MLSHDVDSCCSLQSDKVRYGCLSTIGTYEGLRMQILTNLLAACMTVCCIDGQFPDCQRANVQYDSAG
jgi:hypothetical protein